MTQINPQQAALRYCSRCGNRLVVQHIDGRERPTCAICGFVVYLDPKVACGVLLIHTGRVLLVRRRNEPGRGLWCLPCGFADADEPPEVAAARELREEAGLDATIEGLLGIYHYTDDPRGAGILLIYRASSREATPHAGDDADDVGFFSSDNLPPLSHQTHRRALDDWRRTL
ncbi:MAG TPA: NUDIX hydrolase [Roseiflexaceae bacterium]|nr:NUDIX hydrolase [Roseiflexaceae bacterium]HMP39047.1 NUDIX hydrolase [Roseiflexaceae bacterium]